MNEHDPAVVLPPAEPLPREGLEIADVVADHRPALGSPHFQYLRVPHARMPGLGHRDGIVSPAAELDGGGPADGGEGIKMFVP